MDYQLPEELKMLQRMVRRFVEDEIIPHETQYHDADYLPPEIGDPLREKVKELGLWNMDRPEEEGGVGLSTLGMCVVLEEQYRTFLSKDIFDDRSVSVLLKGADPEVYQRLKDKRGAYGLSEPGAGGDLAGIETTVERDGDNYILNGSKIWQSNSHNADYIIVMARMKGTKRHKGITFFVVEKGTPGYTQVRAIPMMGWDTTSEHSFQNCVVPSTHRLTPEGEGWEAVQLNLTGTRLYNAAWCLGMAQRCQEMAVEYAKTRFTFGEPLANRQGVQFMLAESAIALHATRVMLYDAAIKCDRGEDIRREASMIKVFASEKCGKVIDRALQIHGAAGYSKDLPIERFYRDIRAVRIFEGPNEVHRSVIARNLLRG